MSFDENMNNTRVWPVEEVSASADQPLLLLEAVSSPTKLPTACLIIVKEASAVVFNYFITSFASMTSYNFLKGTAPEKVLGAYGIASSCLNIAVFSIIVSLNYGLLTKLSHANGSKKYTLMGNYLHQGFLINIIVLIIIVVICFFSGMILKAFGYDPTVADNIKLFLTWDIGAMVFYMIYNTLNYYLSACKIFKPAAIMQLIAAPCYILVSYYLIKVQDLGLKGAALASTMMYGILALLITCYIYFKRPAPEALFLPSRRIFSGLWKLFKDEVMVGSMVFAEWVGLEIIALTAGLLPLEYLTAYPIAYSIMALTNNFPLSLTTVFTSYISNNLAENKPSEAKIFFKATLLITVCVALMVISLFSTIGDKIASLMVDDPEVIQHVLEMLRIYSIALLFDYSQQILGGALRSANKKKLGFYVAMSSMYIIAIPLALVLCFVLKWKTDGLITGIDIGAMVSFTSYTVAHFRLNWKVQAKKISQKLVKP